MFIDLNINLPGAFTKASVKPKPSDIDALKKIILMAKDLGYRIIALNHTIDSKPSPDHLNVWENIPEIEGVTTTWTNPQLSSSSAIVSGSDILSSYAKNNQHELIILRRLTIELTDNTQNFSLNSMASVLNPYDIIALRPTTEKLLQAVCSGTYQIADLISLDLDSRLPFYIKMKTVMQGVESGYSFEISYSGMINDTSVRRQWISNTSSLVRATRGRGLVISSGSSAAFDLRPPYDLTNLGTITGMNPSLSKCCLSTGPRAVICHAVTRRFTLKSVIGIGVAAKEAKSNDSTKRNEATTATRPQKKRKANDQ
ncbi:RNA-binding RNA processing protein rpp1 [Mycoemilia scoparia]|uniref:RNA-binding RNA processing protein rpp1 n=1 Tax=Mycoemilia scoparia TaxID=417184 RepID=A0A9W8DVG8_9FUNG|nr:RNA-binding RNA processing protein rpp1 [Mycoemilia scoparia]